MDAFWGLGKIGRRWFSRLTKLNCGIALSDVEQPLSHPELGSGSINDDEETGIDRFRNKLGMTGDDFPRPLRDTKETAKRRAACDPVCLVRRVAVGRVWGKAAFTLAEVLITLGIIGVVAAMTMPTLLTKHQKNVTVTSLKRFYSIISQAKLLSEAHNGEMGTWPESSDDLEDKSGKKVFFDKYFRPYMKVVKECESVSDCKAASFMSISKYPVYALSDGMIFSFSPGVITTTNSVYIYVIVDINGDKGPNQKGKDIFYLNIYSDKGTVMLGTFQEKDGAKVANARDDIRDGVQINTRLGGNDIACCSKTGCSGIYQYLTCGALIQIDGWQIKDDYPW